MGNIWIKWRSDVNINKINRGGGNYSKNGEKISDWVDVDLKVGWRCFV